MRFHIVGGVGAIGTLVSHNLRLALPVEKHPISIIHRTRKSAENTARIGPLVIERNGIFSKATGFEHDCISDYVLQTDAAAKHVHIDSLIMATKATAVLPIVRTLATRLTASSTLVLLHNGMGVYEELVSQVFRNPEERPHIVFSANTHGAWTKHRGHAVHTGIGEILLGIAPDGRGRDFEASVDTDVPRSLQETRLDDITPGPEDPEHAHYSSLRTTVEAFLAAEALNASWRPMHQVQMAMRRKLIVNAIVNPLTAILRCKNGEILKDPAGVRIAKAICAEASDVFGAQWQAQIMEENPCTGLFRQPFPLELTKASLFEECERVVEGTKTNRSSTLVDLLHGRMPEVSMINGYLIRLADQYNVKIPVIMTLNDLLVLRFAIPIDKPEFDERDHEVQ